ncbi:MAG: DegT/DnrJ/EryC1/StrS aminotransferase family protein, partial [Actinobacteria bacterium]|nr:DegT/DnrJ/EryC1/StrS aminotransferase family protein [Actinomycetota bacterium]
MLIPHQKLVIEPLDVIKPLFKKPKETIFSDYISNKKVYLTGSGRAALKTIIESNNFKKIGVPAFTCCAVELAIKSAKASPVFIDNHIIPEIKDYPKIDALVLPYNFGFLPNIEKIKKDCKKRNIALIEDCCQALGATYNNKLVGSFGDYSFYSFGISKNIGLLGGALGSAKQEKLNLKSYPKKEIVSALTKGLIAKYVFNPKFYSKKLIQKELVKDQKELNYSMPSFIKKIILIQLERYNEILYQRRKNA